MTTYSDKSQYQWSISLRLLTQETVLIYKVLPTKSINNSIVLTYKQYLYERIMKSVSKVVKEHLTNY